VLQETVILFTDSLNSLAPQELAIDFRFSPAAPGRMLAGQAVNAKRILLGNTWRKTVLCAVLLISSEVDYTLEHPIFYLAFLCNKDPMPVPGLTKSLSASV
jgi:hypothetical protein